ncbi:hypothetical protein [Escherichia coli]|uniref:hypothetical protein n=1 Tax=Escherichia coli TaxID=562 RepID=UPI0017888886|nr:hypothetical protein [Escherichia coli]MBE0948292.1 hypothetical protein [Escherichia coli]MDX7314304.1 hypothetical protein [Escherichia coli]
MKDKTDPLIPDARHQHRNKPVQPLMAGVFSDLFSKPPGIAAADAPVGQERQKALQETGEQETDCSASDGQP